MCIQWVHEQVEALAARLEAVSDTLSKEKVKRRSVEQEIKDLQAAKVLQILEHSHCSIHTACCCTVLLALLPNQAHFRSIHRWICARLSCKNEAISCHVWRFGTLVHVELLVHCHNYEFIQRTVVIVCL
jgi:hypothetical protein